MEMRCDPEVLYHCSPAENRDQIVREGLRAPASLTVGWENYSFVGSITDADVLAVFEVDAWSQPLFPDSDGPGHVQIRTGVPPDRVRFVRFVARTEGGW